MATGITKIANMVNPTVMGDMISANLASKIKFSPLAKIDDSLVGQAGGTIVVPSFKYVGDADDLTEGVAMGTTVLETVSKPATIKSAGKAIEISDQAIVSGYGDPIGEATKQLEISLAGKIDADLVTTLATSTLVHDISAHATINTISYEAIVDAVDKFQEEDDEVKYLFIHPKQKTQLRKDSNFTRASQMGDSVIATGVIGEIAGCQVITSSRVPFALSKYTNLIVKENAVGLFLKRDVNIESDRDILAKTTVISSDQHYATALIDDSKVVKLIVK